MENGIPGDELPANELDEEIFKVRMRAEMKLASDRLDNLADLLADGAL